MTFEKLTIEKIGGLFAVRSGDKFADHLTPDEVLGVVASALFSPKGPIFLRTYEQVVNTPWSEAHEAYVRSTGLALPPPRNLEVELEYQTRRADANWQALCECRGEEVKA